ncbi:hypothetical protein [Flagellimonas sp.]|uniref:hypothetical protein n=1 Tax=Flagellimonas sp. TaxID=2058762 RepID=UPI003BAD5C1D
MLFGFTTDFQQLAQQIPKIASIVVIRMDRMQYLDQSGLYTLEDVLIALRKAGIHVLMEERRYMMDRVNSIPSPIPETQIFETFEQCASYIKKRKGIVKNK